MVRLPLFVFALLASLFAPSVRGALVAAPALPSASAETPDSAAQVTMLQEFNVTSIKQSDKLFELPEASTLISAAEAGRLNAVAIKSLSDVVPNFYIPDYGSRITSSIYVRGIGARMDQPAIGLNVDNVPFLNKDAFDFDIADIVGVEMLRGPQSALYGRNTMAGQINVTTLSPMRYQGWRIKAEYTSPLLLRASIGWYHKFNARHALALSAAYLWSRGSFRNEFNGRMVDPERMWSARAKYIWRISDSVTLSNTLASSGLHQGGYPYENVASGKIAYNDTCFYRRFLLSDGLTINWNTDRIRFSSMTSFQYIDDNMTLDQDFLPLDYFTLTQKKREPAFTQDFVVRSADKDGFYQWLAGAFAFYKHLDMQAPVTFHDYGIAQLIEKHRNESNPNHPIDWQSRSFPLNSDFTMPAWGLAIYHQSDFNMERFKFSLGLRLDYEHVGMSYRSYCSTGYYVYDRLSDGSLANSRYVPVDIDERGSLSKHFLTFIPKLTILYNLPSAEPANIYLNVAKGYKSGGFNTQMFSDVLQQRLMGIMGIGAAYDIDKIVGYKPEYSWNFEVGSHLSFLNSRLAADISLFYILCRDQQLTMFPDGTTTGRIMTNAGKTRSFGCEVSLKATPIDNLSLTLTYGYTNARFVEFNDGRADYAGNYLPYAPGNTLFLQAVYTLKLSSASLTGIEFDINARGAGRIYWNEANSLSQNFYLLPGASVALIARSWQLRLFANNLSNHKYYTFYFQSIGNEFVQRGKPIQAGLSFSINIDS